MKIKIVVRPEDAKGADAAAESARRARTRRSRFGLIALSALVALGAVIAFIFMGREPAEPDRAEQQTAANVTDKPALSEGSDAASASPPALVGSGREGEANGNAAPGKPTASGGDDGSSTQAEAPTAPQAGTESQANSPAEQPADNTVPEDSEAGQGNIPDAAGGAATTPTSPADDRSASPATGGAGTALAPEPDSTPRAGPAAGAAAAGVGAPRVDTVPAKPSANIVRAQLTSQVAGREPVDVLRSPVEIGLRGRNVYYYTEFRNLAGQTVTHRWELDGQEMAVIPFKIGGNRWRVYSSKYIGLNHHGRWRVSAVDKNGAVLASTEFVAK